MENEYTESLAQVYRLGSCTNTCILGAPVWVPLLQRKVEISSADLEWTMDISGRISSQLVSGIAKGVGLVDMSYLGNLWI